MIIHRLFIICNRFTEKINKNKQEILMPEAAKYDIMARYESFGEM